tara:strand:- start:18588 stop:19817 length:1230 start_codon:yes stop_codon:yes gene_type:complete
MKIVHVNYSDKIGGAAIALRRFHNFLLENGIDSKVVVSEKNVDDDNILSINKTSEIIKNTLKSSLSRQLKYFFKTENKNTHSLNLISSKNLSLVNSLKPDYVNLHWIGNETISISDINKIDSKIIWTLHDMWPFCGAEHYTIDQRYIEGYKKNNRPKYESGFDLNKYIWKKKIKNFKNIEKIICTSKWMYNCAKNSYLFKEKQIAEIPLVLDSELWKPYEKKFARNYFNINERSKVILFGADNYLKNKRKGFEFIKNSINDINKNFNNEIVLMLFGTDDIDLKAKIDEFKNIKIINLGKISDSGLLRIVYSCSDLVVIPSNLEAFGLIAMEAAFCGVPCVVFENTGLTSIIDHKKNGYIAKHNSINDFKEGINWCLSNLLNKSKFLSETAHLKFDNNKVLQKYLQFIKK